MAHRACLMVVCALLACEGAASRPTPTDRGLVVDDVSVVPDAPQRNDVPGERVDDVSDEVPDAAEMPDDVAPALDVPTAFDVAQTPADGPRVMLCSRPLLPLSGARVTSQRPTLQFARGPALRETLVELCRDRACTSPAIARMTTDDFFVPPMALAPGVWFWRITPRNAEGATCTSATWQFTVPSRSNTPTRSWGTLFDVNGDGLGDLAVATEAGEVLVYHGAITGLATMPATTITGLPSMVGSVVTPPVPTAAGDLNGDGFVDLAVGLPAASEGAGEVRIYFGAARGVDTTSEVMLFAPDGRFSRFGSALAGVGDLEGDGFADLVVGAPRALATSASDPSGVAGRAYAFHGMPSGLRGIATTVLTGPAGPGGAFGAAIAAAGDVNSDRFPDVIVGAPGAERAYVFNGTALGLSRSALATLASSSIARFGEVVGCAGDVDGDNRADVFAGGAETAGRIDVRPAGMNGDFAPAAVTLSMPDVRFGRAAIAADINADGFSDLVVAAPGVGLASPMLYAYAGRMSGVPTAATWSVGSPSGVAGFAQHIASLGDLNRDGTSELAAAGATGVVYFESSATAAAMPRGTAVTRARVAAVAGSVGGL